MANKKSEKQTKRTKEFEVSGEDLGKKVASVFEAAIKRRLMVYRNNQRLMEMPLCFLLFITFFAPWVVFFGFVFFLIANYKISLEKIS